MIYVYCKNKHSVTEYSDTDNIIIDDKSIIVTENEAYTYLFWEIAQSLAIKFSNYRNLDLQSEVLLFLLNRYKKKGLYAPDKTFKDNELIFRSLAKKHCLYIIRQEKIRLKYHGYDLSYVTNTEEIQIDDIDCSQELIDYIYSLLDSDKPSYMQYGMYGVGKIEGISDEKLMEIMNIKLSRLKELRRGLRQLIDKTFNEVL